MTWEQFWYWIAYFEIEPPNRAEDYRAAMICAQIQNTAGKTYKKMVTANEILGIEKPQPERYQDVNDQKDFFRSLRGD